MGLHFDTNCIFYWFFLVNSSVGYFNTTKIRALSLYIWHTFFCCVFIYVTSKIGGDAIFYYNASLFHQREFSFGTTATLYFTTLLTRGFGLTFVSTFMAFNIIGTFGLLAIDASLKHATQDKSNYIKVLALLAVLIPSMNYWSAGIGKDSIQFMGTGLILWSCIDFKRRYLMFFISLFIIFAVRPHIGAIAIISLFLSLWFATSLSLSKKIFSLLIIFTSLIFIIPYILSSVGYTRDFEFSLNNLWTFIKLRQSFNMDTDAGVDLSSMNFLYILFTYLFRPLPYEAHNIFAFLASLDNIFLLIILTLTIISIIFVKRGKFILSHPTENRWFLLIFSLTIFSLLSFVTSNFGISVRQKWMFMPILLYYWFLLMRVR